MSITINPAYDEPHAELAVAYLNALLDGRRGDARALVLAALDGGLALHDLYIHVFQYTQHKLGDLWENNEISVANEHYCTAATQQLMAELYPRLLNVSEPQHDLRLLSACVGSELHEIGIRMVTDFFAMAGWQTWYVGANTPLEAVLDAIGQFRPDVLALSVTLYGHMSALKSLIAAVRDSATGRTLPILVGGYPFRQDDALWQKVGADGWAEDAPGAVVQATVLLRARRGPVVPRQAGLPVFTPGELALFREHREQLIDALLVSAAAQMRAAAEPALGTDQIRRGYGFLIDALEAAMTLGDTGGLAEQLRWATGRKDFDGGAPDYLQRLLDELAFEMARRLSPDIARKMKPYLQHMVDLQARNIVQP